MTDPKHKRKWQVWRTPVAYEDKPDESKDRPFLITEVRKDVVRGHKITSKTWHYDKEPDKYYKVKDHKKAGLTVKSIVNLNETAAVKKDLHNHLGRFDKKDIKSFSSKKKNYQRKKR